eukprot:2645007-Alexandrium_andersonii.AAC.1
MLGRPNSIRRPAHGAGKYQSETQHSECSECFGMFPGWSLNFTPRPGWALKPSPRFAKRGNKQTRHDE